MAKNQLEMFVTAADFLGVLRQVEGRCALSFVTAGVFETEAVTRFESVGDLSAAFAAAGAESLVLLAISKNAKIEVREVTQNDGRIRYAVDQLSNPVSVMLRPGGVVDFNHIVAGQIGTASLDPHSVRLFAVFRDVVRRDLSKVKSYWVGPQALQILDSGGRLTATLKSAPEYDLKR